MHRPKPTSLQRFLAAVHRRMMWVRLIERGGIGLGVGSAGALAAIPILLWQGEPAINFTLIAVAVGALGGIAWGWARRPTRVEAAVEADRQLRLSELLSTALSLQQSFGESTDPAWRNTILSLAEYCIRNTSVGEVMLRRWGVRAWSGIGLAALLAFTLSIFSAGIDTARAASPAAPGGILPRAVALPEMPTAQTGELPRSSGHAARQSADPTDSEDRRFGDDSKPADTPDVSAGDQASEKSSGRDRSGGTDATGAGSATGPKPASPQATPPTPARSHPAAPRQPGNALTGEASSGAENETSTDGVEAKTSAPAASGTVAVTSAELPTAPPPWKQANWTTDAKRARDALDSGRVPDGYRDLVRDYFDQSK